MRTYQLAIAAVALATALADSATAAEFNDGAIVISDNWCAPFNDGQCFTCNTGRLTTSATCTASYCDNMRYQCAQPPSIVGAATSLSGTPFNVNEFDPSKNFGWASDEHGSGSLNSVCPVGTAMIGMRSTSNWSDNIRAICQTIDRAGGWGDLVITRVKSATSISEEAPNTFFGTNTWLMGAACTGSYCDNMFYHFVTVFDPP